MSEQATFVGRVVGLGGAERVVHVALQVGGEVLGDATIGGELGLELGDGHVVRITLDASTRVTELPETRVSAAWATLSQEPDAARVSSHAPGPHVRATLVRRVLRAGARVAVRGIVTEQRAPQAQGAPGYREAGRGPSRPTHVRALEVARPPHEGPGLGRLIRIGLAGLAIAGALFVLAEHVLVWPPHLRSPILVPVRIAVGAACAMHLAFWLAVLFGGRGGTLRMLPRFTDAAGRSTDGNFTLIVVGAGLFFGTVVAAVHVWALGRVAETGVFVVQGNRGPVIDGGWLPAVLACGAAAVVWLGLLGLDWRSSKLARLFASAGGAWTVRTGRLRSGTLSIAAQVTGSGRGAMTWWSAWVDGPLSIESGDATFGVEEERLVFGMDLVSSRHADRTTTWTIGPGASVAIAGVLGDDTELAARGPESLLLVASVEPDVLATLRRGRAMRTLVLATLPTVVAVSVLAIAATT
jgi:hypothetical protein